MRTESIENLLAVATSGSFSAAAAARHITLSGLSMQIKALERELGAELFDRSQRPPQLTPLGRRVVTEGRMALSHISAMRVICSAGGELTGLFRLGFVPTAGVRLLPLLLARAQKTAPEASFDFVSGLSDDLVGSVSEGSLDAAVVTDTGDYGPNLRVTEVLREDLALVVPEPSRHLAADSLPRQLPFVHFNPRSGIGKLIARSLNEDGVQPDDVIEIDSVETALECVKAGLGYTVVPRPDAERYADPSVFIHSPSVAAKQRVVVLVSVAPRLSADDHAGLGRLLEQRRPA